MDRFKEIESFVALALHGSLSAVARAEGVTPAIVGRRLDGLESRLGVKLAARSTRRITLTAEGEAFLEQCQRILADLASAESTASQGRTHAAGHLKLTAPAGFGRRHIAPILREFLVTHAQVSMSLELTDRLVDMAAEGFDCAIRFGEPADSALVAIRLAENRRVLVASPAYLAAHGTPATPAELAGHACLALSHQRGWLLRETPTGRAGLVRVRARFTCSDGAVLREWAQAGMGIAWRSGWEVSEDIRDGTLVPLLDAYAAEPIPIYALIQGGGATTLRLRHLLDAIKTALPAALAEP
ncbi:MAG: LysR family transcriptional regulator [Rhodocyclaceae bacterium]